MDLGLKGKVALVAAASRGLGRAAHVPVLGVAGDVSVPEDVSRVVGAAGERFGRV